MIIDQTTTCPAFIGYGQSGDRHATASQADEGYRQITVYRQLVVDRRLNIQKTHYRLATVYRLYRPLRREDQMCKLSIVQIMIVTIGFRLVTIIGIAVTPVR